MLGAGADCTTESIETDAASDLSDREDGLDGTVSPVDQTCQSRKEGMFL